MNKDFENQLHDKIKDLTSQLEIVSPCTIENIELSFSVVNKKSALPTNFKICKRF